MAADPQQLRERTFRFARAIVRLYAALPPHALAQVLGKQLLRSGTSIGANYREAARSRSRAEFRAKMGDCLKEADETLYWLDLLMAEEVFTGERIAGLRDECDQLVAMFVASLRTSER
jgi:four helix bundle protein